MLCFAESVPRAASTYLEERDLGEMTWHNFLVVVLPCRLTSLTSERKERNMSGHVSIVLQVGSSPRFFLFLSLRTNKPAISHHVFLRHLMSHFAARSFSAEVGNHPMRPMLSTTRAIGSKTPWHAGQKRHVAHACCQSVRWLCDRALVCVYKTRASGEICCCFHPAFGSSVQVVSLPRRSARLAARSQQSGYFQQSSQPMAIDLTDTECNSDVISENPAALDDVDLLTVPSCFVCQGLFAASGGSSRCTLQCCDLPVHLQCITDFLDQPSQSMFCPACNAQSPFSMDCLHFQHLCCVHHVEVPAGECMICSSPSFASSLCILLPSTHTPQVLGSISRLLRHRTSSPFCLASCGGLPRTPRHSHRLQRAPRELIAQLNSLGVVGPIFPSGSNSFASCRSFCSVQQPMLPMLSTAASSCLCLAQSHFVVVFP